MKESFILYTNAWPMIQKLDQKQRGDLFTAIMCHAVGEDPPEMDSLTDMAFSFIAAQMDRDTAKYQDICERRAEYGRKGGLAKASKSKQKLANLADNDNDNENDNEYENDNENETENEAQERRSESLSQEERKLLDQELGHDKVESLIEEVKLWSTNNGKSIRDWPSMIRQFARNQARWSPERGGTQRGSSAVARAFKRIDEEFGTT